MSDDPLELAHEGLKLCIEGMAEILTEHADAAVILQGASMLASAAYMVLEMEGRAPEPFTLITDN